MEKKKTVVVLDNDVDWEKAVQSSDNSESDTPLLLVRSYHVYTLHVIIYAQCQTRYTVYINMYVEFKITC